MKNKILKVLLAACLLLAGYSQAQVTVTWDANGVPVYTTNAPAVPSVPFLTGPGAHVFDFLTTGSNYLGAVYGILAKNNGKTEVGAGVGVFYKLSEFVETGVRLDYINHRIWMPSGSVQLSLPMTLAGKLTVVPFTHADIATPLSGKESDNGAPVGILGAGMAIRLDFLGKSAFWQKADILFDIETWNGGGFKAGDLQYRAGLSYKF